MSSNAILGIAALAALGAAGCEATITPAEPVIGIHTYAEAPLMRATVVPEDIWDYPRVYFNGTWVYLVDGSWYLPSPRGWYVYRREPVELARERTRIYRAPRPAPREQAPAMPYEQGRERRPAP